MLTTKLVGMTQLDERVTEDFDFLIGTWRVQHRRLGDPLDPASEWTEFEGTQHVHSYLNGAVSVDETTLAEPGHRGLAFRTYDPTAKEWTIYWVDSRRGRLEPPVRGRFEDGVGTFYGTDEVYGQLVDVRFLWSDISATAARWRQAFSVDGGTTWLPNWEMRFTRESA